MNRIESHRIASGSRIGSHRIASDSDGRCNEAPVQSAFESLLSRSDVKDRLTPWSLPLDLSHITHEFDINGRSTTEINDL